MSLFFNLMSVSAPLVDSTSQKVVDLMPNSQQIADMPKFWLIEDLFTMLKNLGFSDKYADLMAFAAACLILVALVWIVDKVIVRVSLHFIKRAANKTTTTIDDIFVERKFFSRLLQLIPLIVVLATVPKIFGGFWESMISFVEIMTEVAIIVAVIRIIYSLLDSWLDIYNRKPQGQRKSIKGYMQVAKIILAFVGGIFIVSILIRKDPTSLFVGLGTAAALLSLVFKDTILGFVASIQLSAQDMVRIGDWISMPSKEADGTVLDINVNSVKVQNWDNTVTMIPIYSMVSESFTNWRGMEQSDGRRFVRYFYFNMESVKFADEKFLAKISRSKIIANHIGEVSALAEKSSPEETLTNLALLRAHIEIFLRKHPKINDQLPLFARYKQEISDKGIGLEIYAFSYGKTAVESEAVQRALVEFVVAVAPLYGMALFQSPSGMDFQKMSSQE